MRGLAAKQQAPQRLYHFTSAKFALDDIRNARLKIAQIEDLNDPFELRCMDTSGKVNRMAYELWRQESAARFGVLCFSERWNDILQWSHYADRHRGICLGFDVAGDPKKFGNVHYSNQKIPPPETPDQDYMWQCLSTKFECWSYEREWRVFTTLEEGTWSQEAHRQLYFAKFGADLKLKVALIGAASAVQPKEIFDVVGNDVRVTHVRLSDSTFELQLADCVRPPQFRTVVRG